MKKLLASSLILMGSITLGWSQHSGGSAHAWDLKITPESSKDHLDSVATAWKKDGIDLEFSKLEYNDKGKLVKIAATLKTKSTGDGPGGSFKSDDLKSEEIKVTKQGAKQWSVYLTGK
jgi:hypothetical protein